MPWVMVPVPEEHVQDVMEYVIRTATRAQLADWDLESAQDIFLQVDEACRSLLSISARAAAAGKQLRDQEAADFIQLNVREMVGIIREVNEAANAANRPPLLSTTTINEELPNGRLREQRVIVMAPTVARLFRTAERTADTLESNPAELGAE
jgi:hypothetical protein